MYILRCPIKFKNRTMNDLVENVFLIHVKGVDDTASFFCCCPPAAYHLPRLLVRGGHLLSVGL